MTEDEFYARVFRSLMAQSTIVEMVEASILVTENEYSEPSHLEQTLSRFSARVKKSAAKMIPVYALYFAFENSVREFVAEAMQDTYGDTWWDKVPTKIRASVETRQKQMIKHKWFKYQPLENVSQLFFGDLASIIVDQWTIFEQFFPSQDWLRVRLTELELSRNIISHANELPDDEISRLNGYLADWHSQVPS